MNGIDLKKELLDLASSIRYADMYDLTTAPRILKEASQKIGELELKVIELQEQVMKTPEVSDQFLKQKSIDLRAERARIKAQLDEHGIAYSVKDNTQRLLRILQKALSLDS